MDFYAVGPDDERYQLCDSFKENIEDLFDKWAPNNEIVLTSEMCIRDRSWAVAAKAA